jgi:hypothetical protein
MSIEIKKEIQLEIAHVLFIDIVGHSKLSINEQRAMPCWWRFPKRRSRRPNSETDASATLSISFEPLD